jgi:ComF family protein
VGATRHSIARKRCVFRSPTGSPAHGVPQAQASAWRAATKFLRSPLQPVLHALSCTLYPAPCSLCALPLLRLSSAPVCDSCWALLRPQGGTLCLRCGEDLGVASFSTGHARPPSDQFCQPCRLVPPPFARALAFGVYEGQLRELIHLLKYRRIAPVARGLGALLATTLAAASDAPDSMLVVPVPLFRSRQRRQGFNHAERVAHSLVAATRRAAPVGQRRRLTLAPAALERCRATEAQASLTPRQRRQNVRGAFAVPRPSLLAGRAVLLLDDIYTTGATARAASEALLKAGAASVWVLTVARAQRDGVARWDLPRDSWLATADAVLARPSHDESWELHV